jgi:hypothetical protein
MQATLYSQELSTLLGETDNYKRLMGIANVMKEISEQAPFPEGDEALIRDRRLGRYLILCLPLMERAVGSVITSLLYKFQGNLYYLHNFLQDLSLVLRQREAEHPAALLQPKKRMRTYLGFNEEEEFTEYFKRSLSPDVRINLVNLKVRCLDYLSRLLKIFELVASAD